MQWGETSGDEERDAPGLGVSLLAMPVRVEVSLTGAPWQFRARLLEARADSCLLTVVDPCAPALRRGASAVLHIGTLGSDDWTISTTISDVSPRPTGLTIRCAIDRSGAANSGLHLLPRSRRASA